MRPQVFVHPFTSELQCQQTAWKEHALRWKCSSDLGYYWMDFAPVDDWELLVYSSSHGLALLWSCLYSALQCCSWPLWVLPLPGLLFHKRARIAVTKDVVALSPLALVWAHHWFLNSSREPAQWSGQVRDQSPKAVALMDHVEPFVETLLDSWVCGLEVLHLL